MNHKPDTVEIVNALAIAVHNIPEGICTSAPHYFTHGNRLKSFGVSSLSALPILLGFLAGRHFFSNIAASTMSLWIGATAGLMIYITAVELMPAAQKGSGTAEYDRLHDRHYRRHAARTIRLILLEDRRSNLKRGFCVWKPGSKKP